MSEDLTKATERPWIAVEGDIWDQRLDEAPGIPLFRADRSHRRYGRPLTDEAREANAALIVAAVNGYDWVQARIRDLEAALQGLIDLYETDEGTRSLPQYKVARAALSDRAP